MNIKHMRELLNMLADPHSTDDIRNTAARAYLKVRIEEAEASIPWKPYAGGCVTVPANATVDAFLKDGSKMNSVKIMQVSWSDVVAYRVVA